MCMKKHKLKQPKFEVIYEPYRFADNDTFGDMLKRYINDDAMSIQKDLVYYRAFQIIRTTIKGHRLIVALSNQIALKLGDTVIDDRENEYVVKGFEMIRLVSGTFPEWYKIISFIVLQGTTENVGGYFAKQNIIKE